MLEEDPIQYIPIRGKTYSLFGQDNSTDPFYEVIEQQLELLKEIIPDEHNLLIHLQKISGNKREFTKWRKNDQVESVFSELGGYLTDLQKHLRQRPFSRLLKGVLSTKEHQYLTFFLEFTLINKLNRETFMNCNYKMALLPHCIRISIPECKAKYDGLDLMCTNCNRFCFIGIISKILKEKEIIPYIWMRMNFGSSIRKLRKVHGTLGILGIACIPELIAGMRKCQKYNIPVVGLPLDANRCIRWMGDFYDNSINLNQLQTLLS